MLLLTRNFESEAWRDAVHFSFATRRLADFSVFRFFSVHRAAGRQYLSDLSSSGPVAVVIASLPIDLAIITLNRNRRRYVDFPKRPSIEISSRLWTDDST